MIRLKIMQTWPPTGTPFNNAYGVIFLTLVSDCQSTSEEVGHASSHVTTSAWSEKIYSKD